MTTSRVLVAVVVCALGCVLAVAVGGGPRSEDHASPVVDRVAPLSVLRDWDAHRADAWRRGDADALASLYTDDSESGLADRALLTSYDARGVRVRDLTVQRSAVEVRAVTADRMVLVVTDRVVGGRASTRAGRVLRLPRDGWSTRTVVLERDVDVDVDGDAGGDAGEWRVVEVREVSAARSPAPR